ncbi:hypothetical protein JCM8547_001174 [Rhodosporidiobolus lusitaniae]
MSSSGTSTGTHAATQDRTTTDASFKPDISTRIADAEQRSGTNPHEPNSHPSALDKVGGAVEAGIGKVLGDKELERKGTVAQGKDPKMTENQRTEAGTHLGGENAYST